MIVLRSYSPVSYGKGPVKIYAQKDLQAPAE